MTSLNPQAVRTADTVRSIRAAWRALAATGAASAADHLLFTLLRGKDPLRAFAPTTNAAKLANGHAPRAGLLLASNAILRQSSSELQAQLTPFFASSAEAATTAGNLRAALRTLADKLQRGEVK